MKHLYLLLLFMGMLGVSAQQQPTQLPQGEASVRLHPNPTSDGVVYVESDSPSPKLIRIFDLFGKTVLERRIPGNTLTLDRLAPGVYMVRIEQDNRYATKKLVIR